MFRPNRTLLWNPTAESAGNGTAAAMGDRTAVVLTAITYAAVLEMKPEQQDALMKNFSKRVTGLKETQRDVKAESKNAAILLAGVEQRVKRGIEAGVYASTFTVSDLYKQITGEKPPGHVYTLKCAFVNYVLSSKVSESDFLANRNNCLELAQKIADAVIELKHPDGLKHDAVTRAAAELISRHENEAKILRGILASVKPAKLMTAEEALEALTEICASGNLPVCLAQMPDEIAKMAEDQQQLSYLAAARTIQKLDAKLGDKVEKWIAGANDVGNVKFGVTLDPVKPEAPAPEATEPEAALAE